MNRNDYCIIEKALYNDAHGFDGDRVNALCYSPEGVLYVGAGYGLFFYEDGVFVKIVGIIDSVDALCCLPGNTVLAVSGRDVYVVENNIITGRKPLPEDVFPGKRINGISVDPARREAWLCSDDGMVKMTFCLPPNKD